MKNTDCEQIKTVLWMSCVALLLTMAIIAPPAEAGPNTIGARFATYIVGEWPDPDTITKKDGNIPTESYFTA